MLMVDTFSMDGDEGPYQMLPDGGQYVRRADYDAIAAELSACKRVGSMMTGAAGQHAETVVELRAQLATAQARVAQLEEQARDFHNVDDVLRLREAERLLRSALSEIVVTDPTATVYGEIDTWLAGSAPEGQS